MTTTEETRTAPCPTCGVPVARPVVLWGGREILSFIPCLCDACDAEASARSAALDAIAQFAAYCDKRIPADYHRAVRAKVPDSLRPVLEWRPSSIESRLGITGAPGLGKSMAVALLVRAIGRKFVWLTGFEAKAIYTRAVTAEGEERKLAAAQWLQLSTVDLLILDDIDKGNCTEAWANALYELIECRNSHLRPFIWTANHHPGPKGLAGKFARCGDRNLADAIERRLCGGARVVSI